MYLIISVFLSMMEIIGFLMLSDGSIVLKLETSSLFYEANPSYIFYSGHVITENLAQGRLIRILFCMKN